MSGTIGIVPFCRLVAVLAAALLASVAAPAQQRAARSLAGVWLLEAPVQALRTTDGKPVPYTAEGRQTYERYRAELAAGRIVDDTRKYCLPDGVPRLLTQSLPFEIVQTTGLVTFLHEAHHIYRTVPLDFPQADPDTVNPTFMGNSVARWEGDTLVIDTIGFNDKTTLDITGMPHTSDLHVVERWRRSDSGKRLRVDVQIEDAAVFSRPWTTRLTFVPRPDMKIQEYVCGEPHRTAAKRRGTR